MRGLSDRASDLATCSFFQDVEAAMGRDIDQLPWMSAPLFGVGLVLGPRNYQVRVSVRSVFTEVIFPNHYEWPIIFQGVGAVLGWLSGTNLVRRHRGRAARIAIRH